MQEVQEPGFLVGEAETIKHIVDTLTLEEYLIVYAIKLLFLAYILDCLWFLGIFKKPNQ